MGNFCRHDDYLGDIGRCGEYGIDRAVCAADDRHGFPGQGICE